WTLWAIPLVILVGLLYIPFLLRLPPRLRWRLILAGGLFLGGAVGIELISSNIAYHQGSSRTYLLITFIEECVEQAGLILFAHTLLTQLANQDIALQVRFTRSHDAERSPSLEMELQHVAEKVSE